MPVWVLNILDIYKPLLQAHWTLGCILEILNFTTANILGLLRLYFLFQKWITLLIFFPVCINLLLARHYGK